MDFKKLIGLMNVIENIPKDGFVRMMFLNLSNKFTFSTLA